MLTMNGTATADSVELLMPLFMGNSYRLLVEMIIPQCLLFRGRSLQSPMEEQLYSRPTVCLLSVQATDQKNLKGKRHFTF
jgi:hypothetical protein